MTSTPTNGWRPSRLIDIGSEHATRWHLKIAKEDFGQSRTPPYMTLSYRWSAKPSLLLVSSNLHDFRRGVHFERLPQLFRDFIMVARRFRVQYIWIDSLCIIQDSQKDWELEAPKMRYVYGSAICNVAASAASRSESSMFSRRTAMDVYPGLVEISSKLSSSRCHYIFDKSYWDRSIQQGSLHDRGWVFQEILLAPRVIYFSNSQILWECLSEHKCEGFPNGIPLHESLKSAQSLLLIQHVNETPLKQTMSYDSIRIWMNLVAKYSGCDFTRPEDKLWAFSGIAELFQGNAAGQYFAGLWGSCLLEMMDWRIWNPRPPLTSTYRAPSWSWASVDGPVYPIKPHNKYTHLVTILEAKTDPIAEPLGGVSSAILRLKGPLFMAKCQAQTMFWLKIYIGSESINVQPYPDNTEIQLTQNEHIVVLLFRMQQVLFESGEATWELVCIMLQIVREERRLFRRTGILTFRDEGGKDSSIVGQVRAAATECDFGLL